MSNSNSAKQPIKILIVDDSAFLRVSLGNRLAKRPDLEIVGYAHDGEEALKLIPKLEPDVVTLDVEMPRMDGITTLRHIMYRFPRPVIMLSSHTTEGASKTISALALGAIDYVSKPSSVSSVDSVVDELVAKVRIAAKASIKATPLPNRQNLAIHEISAIEEKPELKILGSNERVIVIGSSTGGPRALAEVVPQLPADLPATILIVQHMPAKFTRSLADRLDQISAVQVKEAQAGDRLYTGQVLIAPGGFHMTLTNRQRVALDQSPAVHGVRPSVDVTLHSVLEQFNNRVVPVILTGMGSDGASSALEAHNQGCTVIAEDESTSVVWGMPRSVIERGAADKGTPLPDIAQEIISLSQKTAGLTRA